MSHDARVEGSMSEDSILSRGEDVETDLRLGVDALNAGEHVSAVRYLERAFSRATGDSEIMSWYGLSLALGGVDLLRGVALCEQALRKAGQNPSADLHDNLGRAYLAAKYKTQAVSILRRGAALDPSHKGVRVTLGSMGIRRRPVIPFLDRRNPINKYLGKLRASLFPRRGKED